MRLLVFLFCFSTLTFAQNTMIPDPNFEQRLIDLGHDTGLVDGMVPTANINAITELFVPLSNISDLTGIEDFDSLTNLDVIGNPLSNIDLSGNMALTQFSVGQNALLSLNVSNNILLEELYCSGTLLTVLDLTNNVNLRTLNCSNSPIVNLDLSNNIALESLSCQGVVGVSSISSLNVRNGNNSILTTMIADNNSNLACIQVDDEIAANAGTGPYSLWQKDVSTIYSENCIGCAEMDVLGNGISIASGDTTPQIADDTDFDVVNFGNFLDHTFTIENTGTLDLNLTGSPLIEITNSTDFTIESQPSNLIAANGGTTTFVVRYTPSQVGTINRAFLSIANDDCDENPYLFHVVGQSDEPLSLNDIDIIENQIKLFPNPNNGKFTLQYRGNQNLKSIEVYDLNGKRIGQKKINNFVENYMFDFKFPKGVYFLKVYLSDSYQTAKLIMN